MPDIRLSRRARADLAEINEFGADRFGDAVADNYARGFREAFDRLRRHPHAGVARPDIGDDMRAIGYRSHRVYYRPSLDEILIVRILHAAMDVHRAFGLLQ